MHVVINLYLYIKFAYLNCTSLHVMHHIKCHFNVIHTFVSKCLNLITKFFLIVACIIFFYEKKNVTLSVKQLGKKKVRENNGRRNFLTFSSIKIIFTLINSPFFLVLTDSNILQNLILIIQLSYHYSTHEENSTP